MKKLLFVCLVSTVAAIGLSTQAAQVSPTPAQDISRNGTSTGSAVMVLQDGTSVAGYRTDCTLQNNGTHVMYYNFEAVGVCPSSSGGASSCTSGGNAPTVTTASKQLPVGGIMNCNNGVTISSTALSILGTNADTYALTEQFVRGQ